MKVARAKAQARLQRRKLAAEGLNWWAVGALALVLACALFLITRLEHQASYFADLQRQGAVFYAGTRPPSLRGWLARLVLLLTPQSWQTWFGDGWGYQGMVTKVKVAKHGIIAFVPNTLALSANSVSPKGFRKSLREFAKKRKTSPDVEPDSNVDLSLVLTAVAAIVERRNGSSAHAAWLRDLPEAFLFSHCFTEDQRAALRGTVAEKLIQVHESLVQELISAGAEIQEFDRAPLTADEAVWGIGLMLHHGLQVSGTNKNDDKLWVLAPGFLDGVERHWNPDRCAELLRNVAATGRLPGWAMVASLDMTAGDAVWLCSHTASNAQLLAQFGVAYGDNPHGPVLLPHVPEDRFAAAQSAVEAANCQPEHVTSLALQHSPHGVLTDENIRCNSLLWMDDVGQALSAIAAGYFATWPRRESIAEDNWLNAEAFLYNGILTSCNRSAEALARDVDDPALERLRMGKPSPETMAGTDRVAKARCGRGTTKLGRLALLVREREQALYAECQRWASDRVKSLGFEIRDESSAAETDMPFAGSWPPFMAHEDPIPTHTEL